MKYNRFNLNLKTNEIQALVRLLGELEYGARMRHYDLSTRQELTIEEQEEYKQLVFNINKLSKIKDKILDKTEQIIYH